MPSQRRRVTKASAVSRRLSCRVECQDFELIRLCDVSHRRHPARLYVELVGQKLQTEAVRFSQVSRFHVLPPSAGREAALSLVAPDPPSEGASKLKNIHKQNRKSLRTALLTPQQSTTRAATSTKNGKFVSLAKRVTGRFLVATAFALGVLMRGCDFGIN